MGVKEKEADPERMKYTLLLLTHLIPAFWEKKKNKMEGNGSKNIIVEKWEY